jgi:hypothetical protein
MKLPLRVRECLYGFALVVALMLFLAVGLGCQSNDASRVRIQLHDLPDDKQTAVAKPAQPPPNCPPAGIAPLQPSQHDAAHHTVVLRWNASLASKDSDSQAIGYCLYRSKAKHAAKNNPICPTCERINTVPIKPTGCVDDIVTDSTVYYYVVTAINAKGRLSSASNEIRVAIPSAKQSMKPSAPNSLPFCRETGPAVKP